MLNTVYDFTVKNIDGQPRSLRDFEGQVLLIVNVASKCGFTPQYEGLEALQKEFGPRGFTVLGFPCNQFGAQEPGDEKEIKSFCKLSYDVSFPLFAKVDVNGPRQDPLYRFLKREKRGLLGTAAVKWNFTKFLVDKKGRVQKRLGPSAKPESLRGTLEAMLQAPA
jgi:glutathione peroxidase